MKFTWSQSAITDALPGSGATLPEGAVVSDRVQHGMGVSPVSPPTIPPLEALSLQMKPGRVDSTVIGS
jgi:hypothetical protein